MSVQPLKASNPYVFIGLALGVSIAALLILPPAGYVAFTAFAIAAWVRKEPALTRWVLTALAATLIAMSVAGWGVSFTGDGDGKEGPPPPPRELVEK